MMSTSLRSSTLVGKVAIVSGSSSGIGRAVAEELSRRGAHVVINYPFPPEKNNAQAVLDGLEGKAKSIIVEADLSTITGPADLARAAANEFGKIDILINNAGIGLFSNLDDLSDEDFIKMWENVVHLNARGTLLLTRAVLKYLSRESSRIINIASVTSRVPDFGMSIYAGSKGMIESFTRSWAKELPRTYGCTVNTVAPGPVSTPALQQGPSMVQESIQKQFNAVPVAPRMAKPEELAWVVASLCEGGAAWVNGVYVPVDGGYPFC